MYGYVYKTTDTSNGKIYIGQHKSDVFDPKYNGSGKIIQRIKKKRPQDLTTEVIEWCVTRSKLNEREKYWISIFDSQNIEVGYNIAMGGEGGVLSKDGHLSEEHRKKLSIAHFGRKHSDETKNKISESNKGRHWSDESKQKLSEYHKGKKLKPHSEETKQKIRASLTGRHHSEESKIKMSESCKGRKMSEETKQKIRKTMKDRKRKMCVWINLQNDLFIMDDANAPRHHPDWIFIEYTTIQ